MSSSGTHILVVEDNLKDLKLTMHALKSRNLVSQIEVARDGEEALDYLFCRARFAGRSFENPPRLVLLDLKLPKIDGLEVLRALKNDPRTRPIPVVIMTASNEEKDVVEGYHLGTNAYIQKPVNFEKFQEIVELLGMFWLVVNQPPPASAFRKD